MKNIMLTTAGAAALSVGLAFNAGAQVRGAVYYEDLNGTLYGVDTLGIPERAAYDFTSEITYTLIEEGQTRLNYERHFYAQVIPPNGQPQLAYLGETFKMASNWVQQYCVDTASEDAHTITPWVDQESIEFQNGVLGFNFSCYER